MNFLERQTTSVFFKEAPQVDFHGQKAGWNPLNLQWSIGYSGEAQSFVDRVQELARRQGRRRWRCPRGLDGFPCGAAIPGHGQGGVPGRAGMKQLGIGLIGCGFWANEMHIPAFLRIAGARVAGVASRSRESAEYSAKRFGIDFWTTDYRELIERADVDIVDILTPNHLHAPIAIEAAARGKHVICIKPLATTLEDADAMLSAAARAGTNIYYAENVPFIPSLTKAGEIIKEGGIGDVIRVKACEGIGAPHSAWFFDHDASGGGAIIDMAVHGIAFCRWMAESEVGTVYAEVGSFLHAARTAG